MFDDNDVATPTIPRFALIARLITLPSSGVIDACIDQLIPDAGSLRELLEQSRLRSWH